MYVWAEAFKVISSIAQSQFSIRVLQQSIKNNSWRRISIFLIFTISDYVRRDHPRRENWAEKRIKLLFAEWKLKNNKKQWNRRE